MSTHTRPHNTWFLLPIADSNGTSNQITTSATFRASCTSWRSSVLTWTQSFFEKLQNQSSSILFLSIWPEKLKLPRNLVRCGRTASIWPSTHEAIISVLELKSSFCACLHFQSKSFLATMHLTGDSPIDRICMFYWCCFHWLISFRPFAHLECTNEFLGFLISAKSWSVRLISQAMSKNYFWKRFRSFNCSRKEVKFRSFSYRETGMTPYWTRVYTRSFWMLTRTWLAVLVHASLKSLCHVTLKKNKIQIFLKLT